MEINFVDQRSEKEWIEVVNAEIELTTDEIKQLLEKEGYRFTFPIDGKRIKEIIVYKQTEETH